MRREKIQKTDERWSKRRRRERKGGGVMEGRKQKSEEGEGRKGAKEGGTEKGLRNERNMK